MTSPAVVQTLWAELIAATLADAGVRVCVISPGSRSTPLVTALAADARMHLPTIIDERAAAFYALGVARATNTPCALVCTSGSAAAHYLPAIVEAATAGVPLIAITADRPPELQQCGASQTIDQTKLYGTFVRGAFDLGAPTGTALALRAVRRTFTQAITLARGPAPGPVHINVPLRKPLEPALPATDDERALARVVADLRRTSVRIAPPRLAADRAALDELAAAIVAEPRGIIVAGSLPAHIGGETPREEGHPRGAFSSARDAVFALVSRAGYPLLAEAGSQLRYGARPTANPTANPTTTPTTLTSIDHADLILGAPALGGAPAPRLVIQIGAEPVAQGWGQAQQAFAAASRWVLSDHVWRDPDSSAHAVVAGDIADSLAYLCEKLSQLTTEWRGNSNSTNAHRRTNDGEKGVGHHFAGERTAFAEAWRALDGRVRGALDRAIASHPRSETAVLRSVLDAMPAGAILQLGNSLPIRVVDHVRGGGAAKIVITQRGAAGIDGLVASAAGATHGKQPVVLVLGDVSFAHDLGGLLAARAAVGPLAIVVVDNSGGRIFEGLPIVKSASAATFEQHWLTEPGIDPAAVASALGAHAVTAASPAAVGAAVEAALASGGVTVVHAPVSASGAHDVRRDALELLKSSSVRHAVVSAGASHV